MDDSSGDEDDEKRGREGETALARNAGGFGSRFRLSSDKFYRPSWVSKHPEEVIGQLLEREEEISALKSRERQLEEWNNSWQRRVMELESANRMVSGEIETQKRNREELTRKITKLERENRILEHDRGLLLSVAGKAGEDRLSISSFTQPSRLEISQAFKQCCNKVYLFAAKSITVAGNEERVGRSERKSPQQRRLAAQQTGEILRCIFGVDAEMKGEPDGLIEDGRSLARQLAMTNPAHEVWFPEAGAICDDKAIANGDLEAFRDSEESGRVEFTVFPGLRVGTRSLVPAAVWVTSEIELAPGLPVGPGPSPREREPSGLDQPPYVQGGMAVGPPCEAVFPGDQAAATPAPHDAADQRLPEGRLVSEAEAEATVLGDAGNNGVSATMDDPSDGAERTEEAPDACGEVVPRTGIEPVTP